MPSFSHQQKNVPESSFSPVEEEIKRLLRHISLEVTPKTARDFGDFSKHLPLGMQIFVTHLPGKEWQETVDTAITLHTQGMRPALHVAARSLKDKAELLQGLHRLEKQQVVCDFLLLAGGGKEQIGPFSSSIDLLESGQFHAKETKVFFAGHPEGSPDIKPEAIQNAIIAKNAYAQEHSDTSFYLITQFCFTFAPIADWLNRLLQSQNSLPVIIGIPGIASIRTLFQHAKACGIGNSIQFLTKRSKNFSLLKSQHPNKLLYDIALHNLQSPSLAIHGLHLYPFGGLEKNLEWRHQILSMTLLPDSKDGFRVAHS